LEDQPTSGKRGRPKKPNVVIDPKLQYATVHETRDNGKVVKVERNIIFGGTRFARFHKDHHRRYQWRQSQENPGFQVF